MPVLQQEVQEMIGWKRAPNLETTPVVVLDMEGTKTQKLGCLTMNTNTPGVIHDKTALTHQG